MSERKPNFDQARFHKTMLAGLETPAGSAHPDAEQLAAFSEQALSATERASVLSHIAGCADCRNVLYALSEDANPAAIPAAPERRSNWRWLWTPALAAATFSVVFLMHRDEPRPRSEEEVRPVIATAPSKPFVQPKAVVSTRGSSKRKSIPQLPPPPAVVAKTPLFVPLAGVSKLNPPPPVARLVTPVNSFAPSAFPQQLRFMNAAAATEGRHWTVDGEGQLQRSSEHGLWTIVSVGGTTRFTAVASTGLDVWAGRVDAALYHSGDGGQSWMRIEVEDERGGLTAPITALRAISPGAVEIRIASGERWSTTDAGRHWTRDN